MRSTPKRVHQLLGKKLADGKVWYLVRWLGTASSDDDDTWEEAASLGEDEWLVSEWEQDQEADDNASQTAETAYLTTVERMLHHSDQTTENPSQVLS
jgi:hypothetical protein